MQARYVLAAMAVTGTIALVWFRHGRFGKRSTPAEAQEPAQRDSFRPGDPSPAEVCGRLDVLRLEKERASTADETCLLRMETARELDGPTRWRLRSRCIIDARILDEAYRCNAANYPEWPAPARVGR